MGLRFRFRDYVNLGRDRGGGGLRVGIVGRLWRADVNFGLDLLGGRSWCLGCPFV